MQITETIWHVWAMHALTQAGGSGEALDALAETRERIEEQTGDQIAAVGLEWTPNGIISADGRPVPVEVYDGTVTFDITPREVESLNDAYYGTQVSPPYAWPQSLLAEAKRAARTLGPVLREMLQEAISWRQYEAMPPGVKAQVKAALLREGGDNEQPQ